MRRDQALDPRPASGEFLFCLPVVGCHPPQQFRSGPVRIDAADIVFPLPRPTVVPFVVPEVEVPPSLEVTNPRPASDFHFIPLSRGILSVSMSLSGGGVRNNSPHPEVQIQGRDASLGTERLRMTDAVIVGAVRTPMGRHHGILKDVRPDDLAALVVGEVVRRAGLHPALVEEVYLGCANQAGEDNRNVARMAALLAGFPVTVAGVSFNRLCSSGLAAINAAARAIKADEGDGFVGGGVESMTRGPHAIPQNPDGGVGSLTARGTNLGWRLPNPRLKGQHGNAAVAGQGRNPGEGSPPG